jgi:hypothetical protein
MKLSLLLFLFSSLAFSQSEIIQAPVDHLYVPTGFDSNDAVEVVVTGKFPNTCYSRNSVDVKIKGDIVNINITAIAPAKPILTEKSCPQMVVPFKEVVTIGNLQGGNYEIRVNQNSATSLSDELVVAEAASNSVDDSIYAAVEWVEKKSNNEVVLHGWKYSDCLELDKVKIVSNNKDTLSVLPVMKQVRDFCPMKGIPSKYDVKFDVSSLKFDRPLLHVRTMDGKSVNSIIEMN